MKILGLEFGSRARHWYRTEPKETFLVVDTSKITHYYGGITSYDVCETYECDTEAEVDKYLDEYVSKSDRKYLRVFKEIAPTTTQSNP